MATLPAPHPPSRQTIQSPWNALLSSGRLYDLLQLLVGRGETARRLRRELDGLRPRIVVDVGAGTGNRVEQLPPSTRYIWLDIDPAKLQRFREKWPKHAAVLSDANHVSLADGSSDCTLCVAVTHHLPAAALARVFGELARITRGYLLFVDAVHEPTAWAGRFLWRLDRGAYPHTEQTLIEAMSGAFRIEHVERYSRYHHYLLCRATPIRDSDPATRAGIATKTAPSTSLGT
jgi:SAM-dependent methyltransferase